MAKTPKNKNDIRGNGHMNVPNLNSPNENIGYTYTVRGLKDIKAAASLEQQFDDMHDLESFMNVEITHYGTVEQELVAKYKINSCGSEAACREVEQLFDSHLKTMGGQTVLDIVPSDEKQTEKAIPA